MRRKIPHGKVAFAPNTNGMSARPYILRLLAIDDSSFRYLCNCHAQGKIALNEALDVESLGKAAVFASSCDAIDCEKNYEKSCLFIYCKSFRISQSSHCSRSSFSEEIVDIVAQNRLSQTFALHPPFLISSTVHSSSFAAKVMSFAIELCHPGFAIL